MDKTLLDQFHVEELTIEDLEQVERKLEASFDEIEESRDLDLLIASTLPLQ